MINRPDRRDFLMLLCLGACALAFGGWPDTASSGRPPNIILILIDDLGWKDAGFMGNEFFETPHLDRLAERGAIFTQAYANAPNCAPSRACLVSGQYTPRHGIYTVGASKRGAHEMRKLDPPDTLRNLDPAVVSLAEALKPAGYRCGCIGKWNLGDDPDHGPLRQGFDVSIGGGRHAVPHGYFAPYHLPGLAQAKEGEYLTDRLTDEAIRFIDSSKDAPFFLFLSHYAVHTPIEAKEALLGKYRDKGLHSVRKQTYAAMMESVDEGVGKIVDELEALSLEEDTAILFFSDNGGHEEIASMGPLHGEKGTLYEGGIRVPLFIAWPGRAAPGTYDEPVMGTDLYPTILELAGAPRPEGYALDGESLAPLITRTGGLDRGALFWHFPVYQEDWKGGYRATPVSAVRQGDFKLLEFFEDSKLELYNLKEDPGETTNLVSSMPEKAEVLHRCLREWQRSVNAPVDLPKNPLYDPGYKIDLEEALKIFNERNKK